MRRRFLTLMVFTASLFGCVASTPVGVVPVKKNVLLEFAPPYPASTYLSEHPDTWRTELTQWRDHLANYRPYLEGYLEYLTLTYDLPALKEKIQCPEIPLPPPLTIAELAKPDEDATDEEIQRHLLRHIEVVHGQVSAYNKALDDYMKNRTLLCV